MLSLPRNLSYGAYVRFSFTAGLRKVSYEVLIFALVMVTTSFKTETMSLECMRAGSKTSDTITRKEHVRLRNGKWVQESC